MIVIVRVQKLELPQQRLVADQVWVMTIPQPPGAKFVMLISRLKLTVGQQKSKAGGGGGKGTPQVLVKLLHKMTGFEGIGAVTVREQTLLEPQHISVAIQVWVTVTKQPLVVPVMLLSSTTETSVQQRSM